MVVAAPSTNKPKKPQATRVAPTLTPVTDASKVAMPVRESTRGSKTIYPFDSLTAVGMSFGCLNKKAESLTSIISNQNRKTYPLTNADGTPQMVAGEPIKDANGVAIGPGPMIAATYQKHFFAVDCDAKTDPDKATVRVFRDK